MYLYLGIFIVLALAAVVAAQLGRKKNLDIIAVSALRRRKARYEGIRHVFFAVTDHFEPYRNVTDDAVALKRVEHWRRNYPLVVDPFRDNSGRPPQHTFFYPQEDYEPRCLELLAELQREGFGDVEIHLHHDNDTSDGFRDKIESFKEVLRSGHGLLHKSPQSGQVEYAFIHGNYALHDSGVGGRWCGVKDEMTVLKETGCYADFTFPSAPHPTQPPITNQIYYATGDPSRPKSHHSGVEAAYGAKPEGQLLLINGPLTLNWRQRRRGIFPAVETGDITFGNPPTPDRVQAWGRLAISVRGWPRWIFIKVHTHGSHEANPGFWLSAERNVLYKNLLDAFNDGQRYVLHFVTAREMYLCVKALESADADWIDAIENFDYLDRVLN